MEYLTQKFENTADGIRRKDAYTQQVAAQGYRIISEQVENGHVKGNEQCCNALICLPLIFMAGRTPGNILVTYGRELLYCNSCGTAAIAGSRFCSTCRADLSKGTSTSQDSARAISGQKQEAAKRTADINKRRGELDGLLTASLALDHQLDWNSLKDKFSLPPPHPASLSGEPPQSRLVRISLTVPFIENIIPPIRRKRLAWQKAKEQNQHRNQAASAKYDRDLRQWQDLRDSAEKEQKEQIEAKRRLYLAKDADSLHQYWAKVLEQSHYPSGFPRSYTLGYAPADQRLIVDSALPPLSFLPQVVEVKYEPNRNTLEEVPVSQAWVAETYAGLAIKIALRTIYELFQSDVANALTSVAFNGRIRGIDKSTGQDTNVFVISVEASKAEFTTMNLAQVDPKACFTRLKGILSNDLTERTPIAPIRFASSVTQ